MAASIAFSPDGKQVAIAASNSVVLRDANTGSVTFKLEGVHAVGIKFTPDGSRLITLDADGNIAFWDPSHGDSVLAVRCGKGRSGTLTRAFDISMERLVCVTNDGTVHAWDARPSYNPGARELATTLLQQHFLVSEAVQYLEKDLTVAKSLRKEATEELQARHDDLTGLTDWVGDVVTAAVPSQREYRLALRRLEAATGAPAPGLTSRLGEVQYRLGRYDEALKSLSTSPDIDSLRRAFLAMTYQRLGRFAEAQEQLNRVRGQLPPVYASSNPATQQPRPDTILARLLQEAENLIDRRR